MDIYELMKEVERLEEKAQRCKDDAEYEMLTEQILDILDEMDDLIAEAQEAYPEERTPMAFREIMERKYGEEGLLALSMDIFGEEVQGESYEEQLDNLADLLLHPEILEELVLRLDCESRMIIDCMLMEDDYGILPPGMGLEEKMDAFPYTFVNQYSCVELATEFRDIYDELLDSGLDEKLDRMDWIVKVSDWVSAMYLVAPEKIFFDLCRSRYDMTDEEILEFYRYLPEEEKAVAFLDGRVMGKEVVKNGEYLQIEDMQFDVEPYIPSPEELDTYCRFGYTRKEEIHEKIEKWMEIAGVEKELVPGMMILILADMMEDPDSGILGAMMDEYAIPMTDAMREEAAALMRELEMHTRNAVMKGHMGIEVLPQESLEFIMNGGLDTAEFEEFLEEQEQESNVISMEEWKKKNRLN